ncbi:MAG TPA: 3-deoxy-D-manno-octulosonic acid transferase [Xanthomonadaceae bacterium]|jgi:3-deoxy-D-manno-octulosonic-acid transferase|nr:3-deoxy-D-manno-octulosonic acid transferase [Xanthomonadaceae bacterium]
MSLSLGRRLLLAFYSALLWLLVPITLYHLVWRGLRQREYLLRWSERYAQLDALPDLPAGALWVHAVSVGEVNAAIPLVNALRQRHPERPLLITTITPTGSARVRALWGDAVHHVYLPYDLHGMVRRFLERVRPALAVVIETELWPNLFVACARAEVPVVIANARLSERSMRGYRWMGPLIRLALSGVRLVAAQSEADAARFRVLAGDGVRIEVTGNLKFDQPLPQASREEAIGWRKASGVRPTWVAASTHAEEEEAVLEAHLRLRARHRAALLLWAPRHPERFDAVAARVLDAGLVLRRRSRERSPDARCDVFLIDSLGELPGFLAAGDVAFVGGSLCAVGGHNLLEPAALGLPLLSGPHTFNFAEISAMLAQAGALQTVGDAAALADAVSMLLAEPERARERGRAGRLRVDRERGALERTLALIDDVAGLRRSG